jgi:hypothetical protein
MLYHYYQGLYLIPSAGKLDKGFRFVKKGSGLTARAFFIALSQAELIKCFGIV